MAGIVEAIMPVASPARSARLVVWVPMQTGQALWRAMTQTRPEPAAVPSIPPASPMRVPS